jgi:NAD(P)-dependent dehydrogenase (short-subunit alcohol dehydrogenase family)
VPEGGFAPWTGAQARRRDPFRKRIGRATVDDVWGISGKAALVTGAASGIGRATTLALIGAGCRVAALDRDEAGLAALTVEAQAGRCVPILADLASPEDARAGVRGAISALGGIDILVNNAGIGFRADVLETTLDQWDLTFAINARAPFIVCQEVLPGMLERGAGVIVNVASVGGLIGIPYRAAYGASKAALISLTRSLTVDYASKGIRANCVAPGTTETPWVDRIIAGADEPAIQRQQMAERQIIGRLGSAEEIAGTILFLASSRASFFHGSAVVVDGGYSAR